eukprot:4469726-Pyramimonas_sp.AAC.1
MNKYVCNSCGCKVQLYKPRRRAVSFDRSIDDEGEFQDCLEPEESTSSQRARGQGILKPASRSNSPGLRRRAGGSDE